MAAAGSDAAGLAGDHGGGPLAGVTVVSVALNLPGPAALERLRLLGACCIKVEPPPPPGAASADQTKAMAGTIYDDLHQGIEVVALDLRTADGQAAMQAMLSAADLLLTSFRRGALARLGLDWAGLHERHPRLCMVAILGATGAAADRPGHDLTYQSEAGLVQGFDLPPTLTSDLGGALMAVEAALALLIARDRTGRAGLVEVGLAEAARWFARPIGWRMTGPGDILGGGHAGYRVYRCRDGQVAAAALEPHFARCLFQLAGLPPAADPQAAATRDTLAAWFRDLGCAEIAALAGAHDLPLHAMPDRATPAD